MSVAFSQGSVVYRSGVMGIIRNGDSSTRVIKQNSTGPTDGFGMTVPVPLVFSPSLCDPLSVGKIKSRSTLQGLRWRRTLYKEFDSGPYNTKGGFGRSESGPSCKGARGEGSRGRLIVSMATRVSS